MTMNDSNLVIGDKTFKIGSEVRIKENLLDEMRKLEFEESSIESMSVLIGKEKEVYFLWIDRPSGQAYATVDLCCEIPIQCLELL